MKTVSLIQYIMWSHIGATPHWIIVLDGLLWEFTLVLDYFHPTFRVHPSYYLSVWVERAPWLVTFLSSEVLWVFQERVVCFVLVGDDGLSFSKVFTSSHIWTLGFFLCRVRATSLLVCRFLSFSSEVHLLCSPTLFYCIFDVGCGTRFVVCYDLCLHNKSNEASLVLLRFFCVFFLDLYSKYVGISEMAFGT